MNNSIYPCIWYNGKAEEAATLYCKAFQDSEITVSTPMVVLFKIKGKQFMGLNGGSAHQPNPSISLFNVCETEAEIDHAWQLLSDGGQVLMPINAYPWSKKYGWIQDKFGLNWQLSLKDEMQKSDVFPSLLFVGDQNGKVKAAMDFYTALFKNSSINLVARYEAGEGDVEGNIKHAQFTLNGFKLAAMESSMQHAFNFDEGLSLVVNCDTQEEIDYYWLNITEEGIEGRCGWCRDVYGVWWQIVPSMLPALMSNQEKAPKVIEAFMKMNKFDIETLKQAAN